MAVQVNETGVLHGDKSLTIINPMARQLRVEIFRAKVIHSPRPNSRSDKIFQDSAENVCETKIKSFFRLDRDQTLTLEKRQFRGKTIDAAVKNKLRIGISVTAQTFVATKKLPMLKQT